VRNRASSALILGLLLLLRLASLFADELPAPVRSALSKSRVPAESLSVYIKQIGAPKPLLAYRADTPRNPASVMKVVTTFAALDILGPDYRWQTRVYRDGPLVDGRLKGNLILQGGGDPNLFVEDFWRLLQDLRNRGVVDIDGDLIIDRSFFDGGSIDARPFDANRYRAYNRAPDAMLVNFGATRFFVSPEKNDVRVFADPPATTLIIDNRVWPTNGACRRARNRLRFKVVSKSPVTTVRLSGKYPWRCGEYSLTRAVMPRDQYVYGVFKALWEEMGGTLEGRGRNGPTPERAALLVDHESRPLSETIKSINKFSNNTMARQLLLTLAAEHYARAGTPVAGATVIADWLRQRGVSMPQMRIDNGSGLSRDARLSARGMGGLLEAANRSRFSAEFQASLPLAGIDGTMQERFVGEALEGRLRMKTGTLNGVRAGAGYLLNRDGKTYVVVMLHNHPGIHNGFGTQVQNVLLRWLYETH
jgi:serine-type D-Ala-D-Ala carboxypeptidase/endopeptidase (penicillin-binding protein 4)